MGYIKKIALLSFAFMVYGGLRNFESIADWSMIIFALAIIAYPIASKKEDDK